MTTAHDQTKASQPRGKLKLVVNNEARPPRPDLSHKSPLIRQLEKMTAEIDEEINFIYNL